MSDEFFAELRRWFRETSEEHRFKPGQSGNPTGKKRRKPSLNEVVNQVMTELMGVTQGGRSKRIQAMEVMFRQMRASAMKGHLPSARILIGMFAGASPVNALNFSALTDEEVEQLERLWTKAMPPGST